ncbi:MAG: PH domain-containing protein, partial [Spirochaetaceae bacterium]|nr:PH domain-containing protein [Spirochaetaceae bacterium]
EKDKEYNISVRTNGISVPKFKSGWMKLRNGKKALTFITDKKDVVLIPTEKYLILFSMDRINEFIERIKEIRKNING